MVAYTLWISLPAVMLWGGWTSEVMLDRFAYFAH